MACELPESLRYASLSVVLQSVSDEAAESFVFHPSFWKLQSLPAAILQLPLTPLDTLKLLSLTDSVPHVSAHAQFSSELNDYLQKFRGQSRGGVMSALD